MLGVFLKTSLHLDRVLGFLLPGVFGSICEFLGKDFKTVGRDWKVKEMA